MYLESNCSRCGWQISGRLVSPYSVYKSGSNLMKARITANTFVTFLNITRGVGRRAVSNRRLSLDAGMYLYPEGELKNRSRVCSLNATRFSFSCQIFYFSLEGWSSVNFWHDGFWVGSVRRNINARNFTKRRLFFARRVGILKLWRIQSADFFLVRDGPIDLLEDVTTMEYIRLEKLFLNGFRAKFWGVRSGLFVLGVEKDV
jgi:hypothetical protein